MKRLIEKTVFWGLVTACRLATWPTRRSPSFVNATTEGVTRPPSAFGITTGSPPSMTATTELVVPRSIPMIFSAMRLTPAAYSRVELMPRLPQASREQAACPKKVSIWQRVLPPGYTFFLCDPLQRRESHPTDAHRDGR